MSGSTANASALLSAGNIEAAEREARAVLDRDPHDRTALDVLISAAVEKEDFKRALSMADDWIGREPDCQLAHQNRIYALIRAGKIRPARAALERYRSDFPFDVTNYDWMQLTLNLASGKSEVVLKQIKTLRRKYGAHPDLDAAETIARSREGQMVGASRAADAMLKNNPLDSGALYVKAFNAFKLCRFSLARVFARQVREMEPRRAAEANEIIYTSYAVYFPPFLITQMVLMVLEFFNRIPTVIRIVIVFLSANLIAMPLILLVEGLDERLGIPHFQAFFYLSMVAWALYRMFLFRKIPRWRQRSKSVKLSSNY